MLQRWRWVLVGGCFLALLGLPQAGVVRASDDDQGQTIRMLRERVAQLEAENGALREQLDALRRALQAPARQVELEAELAAARSKAERLEQERVALERMAGVNVKGELIESLAASIQRRFDPEDDRTVVEGDALPVRKTNVAGFADFSVGFGFSFAGRQLEALPERFEVILYSKANKNLALRRAKAGVLMVDGVSVGVPVVSYQVLRSAGGRTPGRAGATRGGGEMRDERLVLSIDAEVATKIGHATTLSMSVGGMAFDLGRDHIALFEGVRLRPQLMLREATTN